MAGMLMCPNCDGVNGNHRAGCSFLPKEERYPIKDDKPVEKPKSE